MDRKDLDSDSSDSWVSLSLSDVERDKTRILQGLTGYNVEEMLLEAQREVSTPAIFSKPSKCSSVTSSSSKKSTPSLCGFRKGNDVSPQASGSNSPSNSSKTKNEYLILKLKESKRNLDKVLDWSCQPTTPPSSYSKSQSGQNSPSQSSQMSGHNSPVNCTETKATQYEPLEPELPQSEMNSDWVWDWSSQPTANPPKKPQFRHPKRKGTPLSFRNSKAMKCDFYSWEFMKVFIPSFIVTNLITFGLGLYFGRRMSIQKRLL